MVKKLKPYCTEFLPRGLKFSKNTSETFLHNHFFSIAFGQTETRPHSRPVNEALKGSAVPLN